MERRGGAGAEDGRPALVRPDGRPGASPWLGRVRLGISSSTAAVVAGALLAAAGADGLAAAMVAGPRPAGAPARLAPQPAAPAAGIEAAMAASPVPPVLNTVAVTTRMVAVRAAARVSAAASAGAAPASREGLVP